MKCIILAAGYATRLYPLTENFPKPLLPVAGKTIMNRLCDDVISTGYIDEIIVVSNHKFINNFNDWKNSVQEDYDINISIIDDGSTSNENRLGAVKDIAYAIERCNVKDDILVLAGDNVLDFSIKGFIEYYGDKKCTCIMCHNESSIDKLRKTGVVNMMDNGKVISMQEKPMNPLTHWAVPPFYIYPASVLEYICNRVNEKDVKVDAPGEFIEWFCKNYEVYAYKMPGNRYDIGDIESYEKVNREFDIKESND